MEFIPAKTIISGYADGNSWFGENYNMNIYRGCCHGCIYCDSRSECYRIEDFDQVRAKDNALALIARELRSKRRKGVVGTGAMSDPYNPFERELRLTRGALELVDAHGFGASIATKSDLVTRDIDMLAAIKTHSPVLVKITVTTADDELCRKIEPRAPVASRRFSAIRQLSERHFAGILLMPGIPFIEDNDDNVVASSACERCRAGSSTRPRSHIASEPARVLLKLDEHFPGLRLKYARQFGNAYECHSPRASQLWRVFCSECDRLGILYKMEDIIEAYRQLYSSAQLSLF